MRDLSRSRRHNVPSHVAALLRSKPIGLCAAAVASAWVRYVLPSLEVPC